MAMYNYNTRSEQRNSTEVTGAQLPELADDDRNDQKHQDSDDRNCHHLVCGHPVVDLSAQLHRLHITTSSENTFAPFL